MEKVWRALRGKTNESNQELNRSTYSLVSCKDLIAENLQLWLDLPEEVKQDPSLELIRKKYEETRKWEPSKTNNRSEFEPAPEHVSSEPLLTQTNGNKVCITQNETEPQNGKGDNGEVEANSPCPTETVRKTQIAKAKYYSKMTILMGCWMFFTAVFLMYPEKKETRTNLAIVAGQILDYPITSSNSENIELKLKGRFLSQQVQNNLNSSERGGFSHLDLWIQNSTVKNTVWSILLEDQEDFSINEVHTFMFEVEPHRNYTIRLRTNSTKAVPFLMSHNLTPVDVSVGVVYAVVLLCGLYILIIFEIIHRTMAAILVCTCSLGALAMVGERPDLPELMSWLDIETLLLLFSMMILVAIMAETGIFDYLAVFTFEITKGKLWPLIFLLCFSTAFFSTFLDNVTTVLLMSPVIIRLCEVMDLDPVPILMLMAIYSNIGGTATPVGDPPNVIVASNKAVLDAGINFTNFTAHMALGILLICIQTSLQVLFVFRDTKTLRLKVPREIQEIRYQLSIWRRAADSLPHLSNDVIVVREALEKKIRKLNLKLEKMVKDSCKRACPKETFQTTLQELKAKYKIRDKPLLIKSSVAILFVVVLFFLHSIPELNRVSLAWTALLGALLLLILADRADLEPILHRVEWSTLLFFAALFVLIEALAKMGLILYIGKLMEQMILTVGESSRLPVALMVTLWVTGTISAFVDNVPITTMMVRVIISTAHNPSLNLPLPPLIWALLFGACLGGNGTLIGASANIVCAGVAEQHGYKFSFYRFIKLGFPIMIGHFVTASVYLIICHCVFTWH